jgi:hypothetical protein
MPRTETLAQWALKSKHLEIRKPYATQRMVVSGIALFLYWTALPATSPPSSRRTAFALRRVVANFGVKASNQLE